jgi:hypothetical protein
MKNKCTITYREGRKVVREEITSRAQYDKLADMDARFEISIKEISVTTKRREDTD